MKLRMMKNKQKGFTLIEVLIVVAIIGLLASIVLVGLGSFRARGRDARRVADLRQTQNALELYYTKNSAYPTSASWSALEAALVGAGIGVSKLSNDPLGATRSYVYAAGPVQGPGPQSYMLRAQLEDASNPVLNDDLDGTVFGQDCSDPFYCLQF